MNFIRRRVFLRARPTTSQYDPDAQAYFNLLNGPITEEDTFKSAWNVAVIAFKAAGLWNGFDRLYPMPPSNDYTDFFICAKTFNVALMGGFPEYGSDGWFFDTLGINYFDTNLDPATSSNITNTSLHVSFYTTQDSLASNPTYADYWGVSDGTGEIVMHLRDKGDVDIGCYGYNPAIGTDVTNPAWTDTKGFFFSSRTANNALRMYRNGTGFLVSTVNAVAKPSGYTILLGAMNNSGLYGLDAIYSICGFASAGAGISNGTDSTAFNSIVQTYNATVIAGGR